MTVDTITMAHVDEALANAHFIEVKQALRALRLYVLPQRTAAAGDADGCRGAQGARGARGGVAGSLSTESGAAGVGTDGGGEGADVVLRRVAREVRRLSTALVHVLQYLPLSALGAVPGDTAGLEREGESAVCGGEREQDSLRRLLGKGVRLMLREHKEPKIEELLRASPQMSHGGRPSISVDR